jgi:hypothetical protein
MQGGLEVRDYAVVKPRFWTGRTGRALRTDRSAQVLALYLMTSPHANLIGLYYLPLPTIAYETGLSEQEIAEALNVLAAADFAFYDAGEEMILVLNLAREQVGEVLTEGDKRRRAVLREVESVRRSRLLPQFLAQYAQSYRLEAPSMPLPRGELAPTKGAICPPDPDPVHAPDPDPVLVPDQGGAGGGSSSTVVQPQLPGRSKPQQQTFADKAERRSPDAAVSEVLALLDAARKRVNPKVRDTRPTPTNSAEIASRLKEGHSLQDFEHVILAWEAECLSDPKPGQTFDPRQHFDAITPFRAQSFARKHARPVDRRELERLRSRAAGDRDRAAAWDGESE